MRRRIQLWLDERWIAVRAKYETWVLFTVKPWRRARTTRRTR